MTSHNEARQVFLTGATGAMGLPIARELIAAGHDVTGVTQTSEGARALIELGARPIEVDLFDLDGVREAMAGHDVVAHFATSIPTGKAAAKMSSWATNDRLRREGTSNLIAAAEAVGAKRFIVESIALAYPDRGDEWIDESTALDPVAPMMVSAVEAEAQVAAFGERGGEAVSLRFGRLYGPGRASGPLIEAMRARQMPTVGGGANYVSSIHVGDVGTAVAAAMAIEPGTYNVVDDEPMRERDLSDAIVDAIGTPKPRKVPYPLARLAAGKAARVLKVSQRVSNRRFREATGWTPRYASAAEGWAAIGAELAPVEAAAVPA